MEVDTVIERIGGFGRGQKKIVYLANLAHLLASFHALSYTFITDDPGWTCPPFKHPERVCALVKNGTCTPQYSDDFTSIVTEVGVVHARASNFRGWGW